MFHIDFVSVKGCRVAFLGQRSVNGSFEWLDVPRPFFETGVATVAWTENLYVNPCRMTDSPARSPYNTFNLRAVTRSARDNLLRASCLERCQTLSRETLSLCLLDTRDDILSDDDWIEGYWDLAD